MSDEKDIVERLREPMNVLQYDDITYEAAEEIERLRAERDEARKMYCRAMAENGQESEEREIAKDLDWDCWKEDGK